MHHTSVLIATLSQVQHMWACTFAANFSQQPEWSRIISNPRPFKQWLAKRAFHRHPGICTYFLFIHLLVDFFELTTRIIMRVLLSRHAAAAAEVFVFGFGPSAFSETLEGSPPTHYQLDPSCRAAYMTTRQAATHPAPGERWEWRWPIGPLPFNRNWRGEAEGELRCTRHRADSSAWRVLVYILEAHNETNSCLERSCFFLVTNKVSYSFFFFFFFLKSFFFGHCKNPARCGVKGSLKPHALFCLGCLVTAELHVMPQTWICSSLSFHSLCFLLHHSFFFAGCIKAASGSLLCSGI